MTKIARATSNCHNDILGNMYDGNIGKSEIELIREQNAVAHKSGIALKVHCNNAHRGAFNPDCNACKELRRKQDG